MTLGLTGLDSLTEGESGFEEALLNAIAKDETLLDPSEMFKASAGQNIIDAEDAAYWNIELDDDVEDDPLVQAAIELGGEIDDEPSPVTLSTAKPTDTSKLVRYISRYLDTVHLIHDTASDLNYRRNCCLT